MTNETPGREGPGFRAFLRQGDWRSYVLVAVLSSLAGAFLVVSGLAPGPVGMAAVVSCFSGLVTWYLYCWANGWGFDY